MTERHCVLFKTLLFIEDAGLLKCVLVFGYIPHSHSPIIATGCQQSFLTAPNTSDDLSQTEKHLLNT